MKKFVVMSRPFVAGLLLTLALMTGCEPPLKQAEIKFLETREMDSSYDEAYKAASNGLLSIGFTIDHSDKESGVLSGRRYDPRTGAKIAGALLFGVIGLAATESSDEAITFMLTPVEEKVTQLRMKVIKNGRPLVDRKLMTEIWQRIEREAMLETRPSDFVPSSRTANSPSTQPKGK